MKRIFSEEIKKKFRLNFLKAGKFSPRFKGGKHSVESKEKMSRAQKKRWSDPEYKIFMSSRHKGSIAWNKGLHHSEETKKKMSEKRKAYMLLHPSVPWSEEKKKEMSDKIRYLQLIGKKKKSMLGKHHTEDTKKKISENRISNKIASLSKNPNWNGGSSFEPYSIDWNNELREAIRKRDNYQCQECFKSRDELERDLSVHHIDYNKLNNKQENLISLCVYCHSKVHHDREKWTSYFRSKMLLISVNSQFVLREV